MEEIVDEEKDPKVVNKDGFQSDTFPTMKVPPPFP